MADTTTATYGFIKPGINDPLGAGTWGTKLNFNMDAIDSQLSTLSGLISSSGSGGGVQGPKGDKGDTGAQGIQGQPGQTGAKGDPGPAGTWSGGPIPNGAVITGPGGTNRFVVGQTNGVNRWQVNVGDADGETGSNNGSDFDILSYADSGAPLQACMSIKRSTGNASFSGQVTCAQAAHPAFILADASLTTKATVRWDPSTNSVSGINAVSGGLWTLGNDGTFTISSATAYKTGGGTWTATSDERVKDVVGEDDLGLEAVMQLRPVVYRYKGNDGDAHREAAESGREFVGLIAQEVEEIMPDMVSMKDGMIDGERVEDLRVLDTSSLIFALVNACRQLKRELNELRSHVNPIS